MALAWPQGRKRISITLGGQFATLGANVVVLEIVVLMNPHFRIKISLKPNPIFSPSSSFYLSSFSSPSVELMCLFLNDERGSIFSTWNMAMKNTKVTRILCLCSSMVVWLLKFNFKEEAKMRKIMIPRMNEWNHMKGSSFGPWFLDLMKDTWTHWPPIYIYNLSPNNEPRSAQISQYWPQECLPNS